MEDVGDGLFPALVEDLVEDGFFAAVGMAAEEAEVEEVDLLRGRREAVEALLEGGVGFAEDLGEGAVEQGEGLADGGFVVGVGDLVAVGLAEDAQEVAGARG